MTGTVVPELPVIWPRVGLKVAAVISDRTGGPPKRVRREPLTLSAVGATVVIGGIAGTAAGGLTSFLMSNLQQSKINQEIVHLGKRIGKLSKSDQN